MQPLRISNGYLARKEFFGHRGNLVDSKAANCDAPRLIVLDETSHLKLAFATNCIDSYQIFLGYAYVLLCKLFL